MALLDAQPYDAAQARRRRIRISITIFIFLVIGFSIWEMRFLPEERAVNHFFGKLQAQDFEGAYALWRADPDWKQHPEKYSSYSYHDFYLDWGPGGEWGPIRNYKVDGAVSPSGSASGVIVEVIVNQRVEHARVWVEKKDKSLSFPPS
jgi:hypothetical protein